MPAPACYEFGAYRVLPASRELLRDGTALHLTPKAFDTLLALIERRDRVVSKEELMHLLWGATAVEEANLTQQIFLLRRALDDSPDDQRYIATLPRFGYRFIAETSELPHVPARIGPRRSQAPEKEDAWRAFASGRYDHERWGRATFGEAAVEFYEDAIAKEPTFAGAYAALALLIAQAADRPDRFPRGRAAAYSALDLDRDHPDAHTALAMYRMLDWDWSGSEAEFRYALELDPRSAMAHQWYAQLLRQISRPDEALTEARRAVELDPHSLLARAMVGWVLLNQHRYDEALAVFDDVLALEPNYALAIYNKGLVYTMQGFGPEVIRAARCAKRCWGSQGRLHAFWLLALGCALLPKQSSRARAILRSLEHRAATGFMDAAASAGFLAILCLLLHDEDNAFAWLERGVQRRDYFLPNTTSEPWFDTVREHPRFRALRAGMRLP